MKPSEFAGFKRECRRSPEQGGRYSIEPLNPAQRPLVESVLRKTGALLELGRVELALCAQRQGAGLGWIPLRPRNATARG